VRTRARAAPFFEGASVKRFHPVYLLLLIPYAAFIWVPFYNRIEPRLAGIPFFYWWQIAGIFLTALCILPVYLFEQGRGK